MPIHREIGSASVKLIEALQSSPGLLALIVLQIMTLGLIAYTVQQQRDRQFEREKLLIQHCMPAVKN